MLKSFFGGCALKFNYYNLNSNDEGFESLTVIRVEYYCKDNLACFIYFFKCLTFIRYLEM